MNKIITLGFAMFFTFALLAKTELKNTKLLLVNQGKSKYTIVIPDKDPGNRVRKAANLLQTIVYDSTGCKLPILKEANSSSSTPHIYLGRTKAAEKENLPIKKLKDWTFCKRVIGKDIYLLGNDASANMTGGLGYHDREYLLKLKDQRLNKNIKDRSYKGFLGTYKAVSSFLENQMGVRFLLPGPNGLHVPKHKIVKIDGTINFTGSARFPFCYGRCYGDITIPNNHNEIPYYRNYGGHSFGPAVSKSKYGKTHPEYFVLVNGKRRPNYGPGGAGHLCISNPDVQKLMLKELERQFNKGFEWVQIGHTDGCVACQCEKCRALAKEGYGEALWLVYRKIAEEMKKRYPNKKIVFLAYAETKNPPKTFSKFPDNVIIEMCSFDWDKMFKKWNKIKCPKLVYIYNWGTWHTTIFSPKRSLPFLAKQLRLFDKNNVQGIFKCGWGEALGLDGPAYYVYSKLLFDPYADYNKIANDFYRAAYGKACAPMKKFFDALYKRLDFKDGTSVIDLLNIQPRNPEEQISYIFQPWLIVYLDSLLNHALRLDKSPKVQARLKLVKREFDYLKNLTRIYAYYNAYKMSHSKQSVELLDAELKKRDKLLDSWYDKNGKMKQEPGFDWPVFYNLPKEIVRNGGGSVCSPFPGLLRRMPKIRQSVNLNEAAYKAKNIKTVRSKEVKSIKANFLKSSKAVKAFLAGKSTNDTQEKFGTANESTFFKVGYDKYNLYFLFKSMFPAVKNARFRVIGSDGPYKSWECIEIFLDPTGTDEKYYHFVFTPAKSSGYDGRYGFITDSLHPSYGKEDVTWNGQWQYSTAVNLKKQCWTAWVKIPLETLNVKNIGSDNSWKMEIVRRHFPIGSGNPAGVEQASWTTNFDDAYCNINDFGDLDFSRNKDGSNKTTTKLCAGKSYKELQKTVSTLFKQKKYAEALAVIEQMQKSFGTPKNFPNIVLLKLQVLNSQRNFVRMTDAFPEEELAKIRGPHGTFCRRLVGRAYEALGQYDKAVNQYDKASKLLSRGPHAGIVWMVKAECENKKLKNPSAALKSYQNAVDTVGFFESAKTHALYEIAKIQFAANNTQKALEVIDQIMLQKKPSLKWKNKALMLKNNIQAK
jgi:tetratricopeptide (TPR) repeat protein